MRSTFLWRNRVLLTSSALIILCLHFISAGVRPGDFAARPESLLMEMIRPFDAATSGLTDGTSSIVHNYINLVNVQAENTKLKAQLAKLESDRARLGELENENRRLAELVNLKDALGLRAVAANVIGSDATGLAHTLLIGTGSYDGIRSGMAVISNTGVIGKVIATSPHASRVLLLDDHNSALDGFDERSRARGIVAGMVDDGVILKYVDRSQDVRPGDTIITSGLDGIFPRGLLVGAVKSVHREGPGLFLSVSIAPAVDFRSLEQVLVVIEPPPRPVEEQIKDEQVKG